MDTKKEEQPFKVTEKIEKALISTNRILNLIEGIEQAIHFVPVATAVDEKTSCNPRGIDDLAKELNENLDLVQERLDKIISKL